MPRSHGPRHRCQAHPDLLARIRADSRLTPAPEDTGQGSNSIIDALPRQLAAKDTEITKLRAQVRERNNAIANLYGQLEQYQS